VIVDPEDVLSRACCRCCCLISSPSGGGKTSAAVAIGVKLMQTQRDWLQQAVVCEYVSMRSITGDDDTSRDTEASSGVDEHGSPDRGAGVKARNFEAQLYACVNRGPVVVVIDDVDVVVSDGGGGGGGSSSLTLHGLALLRFCRFLTFSSPHAAVVVVATCSAASSVSASPLGGIGLFDAAIQLTEPTARELVAIATTAWSERGMDVDADVDAACFKGHTLCEIDTIIERASTSALMECVWPDSGAVLSQTSAPRISAATISSSMSGWVSAGVKSAGVVESSSSLEDVGGMQQVKSAIFDMLSFQTQHSELFATAPVRVQTGMLLYGYPGCGKTMIVGAACKSVGLPLIVVQGPEILNKYIGASESEVRRVFDRARAVAPCVLFFDEFDAVSRRRGMSPCFCVFFENYSMNPVSRERQYGRDGPRGESVADVS
jgi:peroxin-1